MASYFRITDGKGFAIQFPNGWSVSVQFGWGNYCDNYEHPRDDYRTADRECGAKGSRNAECAVFSASGEMVQLPDFMFDTPEDAYIVSNRSTSDQVLRLMNWASEQTEGSTP